MNSARSWLILVLASLMFVLSQFFRSSVAVITPDLIREMGFGAWQLSTISASFFYAFALMQIPVGLFLDTIGPRIAMSSLTLVAAAGAFLFSQGESAGSLTLARVLLGIGMACNFMGPLKLLTLWFSPGQFATLSAVVVVIGTSGNIAAATPLVLLVQAFGWRQSFMIMAGLTALLAGLFFLVVRDRPQSGGASNGTQAGPPDLRQTRERARNLFRTRDFWIISMATFCRYGIYAAVQALWAGPYLIGVIGLEPVTAGNILFLMSIGLIVGSPICGHLSDLRLKSRKRVIIGGILAMIAILAILITIPPGSDPWILAGLFFGFGLASSSGQVMYAHIKEQVPSENAGLAMTGINFFTMAGVAVFLQGLGSIMKMIYPDASLDGPAFSAAFGFCIACLGAVAVSYTFTRETLKRDPH